jgi:hypothetical protein
MRIGIIGNGFVGKATQIFIKNYNCPDFTEIDVYIYDIRPEACVPPGITLEYLDRHCDLLFFCLPTPLHHDGTCYTRILEETLSLCKNPFKIIRSTVPVGFSAKHRCYFMPEFLTEANWETDFREMNEWVVGLPHSMSAPVDITEINVFKERIKDLIQTSHRNGAIYSSAVVFCETNEAEMLKLMKNCFLSAKVSIMNEFYDFCVETRTDYETVARMAKRDARMGTSHFQVPGPDGLRGFGGTCFPKDTHSLYCQMNACGLTPQIYPAILARNDTHDRPEREWSRDVWRTTIPLPMPASKVVIVFADSEATTATRGYLTDVIRANLAKNNVVIQIERNVYKSSSIFTHPNLIVKHQPNTGTPLFLPRVDECYYTSYRGDTALDTMRGVMNIIDLWNSHKEMILYVIKQHDDDDGSNGCDESDTEGFDSDDVDADAYVKTPAYIDYAKIFEEYFRSELSIIPNQKRGLVVLF